MTKHKVITKITVEGQIPPYLRRLIEKYGKTIVEEIQVSELPPIRDEDVYYVHHKGSFKSGKLRNLIEKEQVTFIHFPTGGIHIRVHEDTIYVFRLYNDKDGIYFAMELTEFWKQFHQKSGRTIREKLGNLQIEVIRHPQWQKDFGRIELKEALVRMNWPSD